VALPETITIDPASIPEDLTNFPVLVSIVDSDLQGKAQADGDDILFMNNTGYATLLNFEIEKYDGITAAWINVSYQNQNDPASFLAIGLEETSP